MTMVLKVSDCFEEAFIDLLESNTLLKDSVDLEMAFPQRPSCAKQ